MKLDKLKKLTKEVELFRSAIVFLNKSSALPVSMKEFPRACCGDASILLGTFLEERGFGLATYVCGTKEGDKDGSEVSHAWLLLEGTIIDITHSQFCNITSDITISKESAWHDVWEPEFLELTNVVKTDDMLSSTYVEIIKILDHH